MEYKLPVFVKHDTDSVVRATDLDEPVDEHASHARGDGAPREKVRLQHKTLLQAHQIHRQLFRVLVQPDLSKREVNGQSRVGYLLRYTVSSFEYSYSPSCQSEKSTVNQRWAFALRFALKWKRDSAEL